MAGVQVDLVDGRLGPHVDAAGGHETHGPVDLVGQPVVALALAAGGDEVLVPRVDPGQVGESTLGEGPQQVQRGRRLVIGGDQPVGVGGAGRFGEAGRR